MVQTLGKWGYYLQKAKRCERLGIWREAYNGARFMVGGGGTIRDYKHRLI